MHVSERSFEDEHRRKTLVKGKGSGFCLKGKDLTGGKRLRKERAD
jgi:hypothetical protein